MDGNSWRLEQGEASAADAASVDWRTELQRESRQRIVNKMQNMNAVIIAITEELLDPNNCFLSFFNSMNGDGPILHTAFMGSNFLTLILQADYLRRIALKLLSMETKSQHTPINPSMVNTTIPNQNPTDPGLSQSNISSVCQTSNLQIMPDISQNSVSNSIGQGAPSDIYANAQRQMQGRQQQQQIISQQQQQSQNQLIYQHQLRRQLLKQKLQHSSLMQRHMQQQSLLQPTQLQSSQQSVMQMSSGLQSGQSSIQQTQPMTMQSAAQPDFQQNQLHPVQQSVPSLLQQHPQSVARQQVPPSMHQQTPSPQQQPTPVAQQSNLSLQQQQQQLMGQQTNISNMQQSQLVGQQNGVPDMQQQQQWQQILPVQQNILLGTQQPQQMLNRHNISLHQQQQLGYKSNISGVQQQLLGSLPNVSNMQVHQRSMHILQQPKTLTQQPREKQQTSLALLQPQDALLPSQNAIEPQKQFVQVQKVLPEIRSMREMYFADLNELDQNITLKLQQHDALIPPAKQPEQYEKMKSLKTMLERISLILQIPKNNIHTGLKEKLPLYEKLIVNVLASNKKKIIPSQPQDQQQFQHPGGLAHSSQVSQLQQHDNHPNQVEHMNLQGSATSMQPAAVTGMQHVSTPLPTHFGVPTTRQNITYALQPGSNSDSAQGSSFNSLQQGAIGCMPQGGGLHQTNEANESKVRSGLGIKPGLYQQHHPAGQHHGYYHQQLKPSASGASFPISSPQNIQVLSPQISHHSSPQVDQFSLLSSQVKAATPLQSAGSPFVPSPFTPLAPSPIPADSERHFSGISSLTNAGHVGHQQSALAPPQALAVGIPDISASSILEESSSPDAVYSIKKLNLAEIHKFILYKEMKNRSMRVVQVFLRNESTTTSRVKRQKIEVNHALLEEEIREINQQLIMTIVNISEENADSVAAASDGEGTVIKCSFTAVALSPSLKSQFASSHMSPILPLRLLIPANYPKCSPVLLDKLPDESSGESDDLSVKAKSRFSISLRGLSQPMSLGEMARTWDACAHKVIAEYAQPADWRGELQLEIRRLGKLCGCLTMPQLMHRFFFSKVPFVGY
ncbi:putative mediator of RNA polymerase II transcription subunit 15a-like [Cocos nucifera]|uniref:Putative mediator of RNA polymerase II transcription subunit 15a-like n=1 Tax=Cocos nucifera TaxID=13894 RepID=A0A8K0N6R7_COCNU|nr:putative mediator of RNA polymerase II transcription subunit 15a-like [Cocos nucifera]